MHLIFFISLIVKFFIDFHSENKLSKVCLLHSFLVSADPHLNATTYSFAGAWESEVSRIAFKITAQSKELFVNE